MLLSDMIIFAVVLSLCLVVASIMGSLILITVLFSKPGIKWYYGKMKNIEVIVNEELEQRLGSNEEE